MVAYMMRHYPVNEAARQLIGEWTASGQMGRLLFARSHGFCGDWTAGLDEGSMLTTDEPVTAENGYQHLPGWSPMEWAERYVEYVQSSTPIT